MGTLGLLSLITSCEPAGSAAPVPDRAVRAAVLTANGSGTYQLQGAPPDVTVSAAPPGVSSTLREAFWSDGQSSAVDGEACVSWGPNDQVAAQPGVALRIAPSTPGHVRALTVSKNVWFTAGWLFNVHVFDTSQPDFRQLATFDLGDVLGRKPGAEPPVAVHLCARVLGARLDLKVWTATASVPSWSDAFHARSLDLDPSLVYPGSFGWYVGHVPPGQATPLTDLTEAAE